MKDHSFDHLLSFVIEHPWNLTPAMLTVVAEIIARRVAEGHTDPDEIAAAVSNRRDTPQPRRGNVAVIPVHGVLGPRMNTFSQMSGGTSYQKLTEDIRAAASDPGIATIVLDIDSPGGSVAGNAELAAEIMQARTKKPIIAQAEYTMASAAYQIAAAATEISAAPSARIGSIGTYSIHDDLSSALAHRGIKRTFISAGEGKVDGHDAGPLSDGAHARMKKAVDDAYSTFVTNVVHGRGPKITAEMVRNDWKAHVYSAADAKALGMIDRVATLDQTLSRLLTPADAGVQPVQLSPRDTPQTALGGSGQILRVDDAQLERYALALQLV
jgi:signal peptide peptidase SppA